MTTKKNTEENNNRLSEKKKKKGERISELEDTALEIVKQKQKGETKMRLRMCLNFMGYYQII